MAKDEKATSTAAKAATATKSGESRGGTLKAVNIATVTDDVIVSCLGPKHDCCRKINVKWIQKFLISLQLNVKM
jgi:hypothetical protein